LTSAYRAGCTGNFLATTFQTTPEMGWAGNRNGELLRLAERQFDVFLTVDRKLQHQQNLSAFKIAVIVLVARSNAFERLRPLMPTVREKLTSARPGEALIVGA
jgi:hypothetical protein